MLHIIFGVLLFIQSKLSIPYGIAILAISFLLVLKTENNHNQVLYVAAYAVGSEVMLRMTGGYVLYEIGKYSIIAYMIMGIYFSGFSKNSFPYWVFLLLMIPGIIVASVTLNLDTSLRKAIAFNISGPVCLGISALYCYQRNITIKELDNILLCMLLPIITIITYLFLYAPSVKAVVTGTDSNFATSGGYGPNQVSTVIGLGTFIVFTRVIFNSKEKWIKIINIILLFIFAFRGLMTFSRGGMICSFIMVISLMFILLKTVKIKSKYKIIKMVAFSVIAISLIWGYSTLETGGLINKRYANEDAAGRVKASRLSGREDIIEDEFNMFLENPIMGVGVGKGKEDRQDESKEIVGATHNEISRMLAEQGSFGILALLILGLTPLTLYINNRQHIYLLSLFIFWLLTINHAAMRIAAPAFVYALSLLHIYTIEKPNNAIQEEILDK
ncbi:O-antigen ligase family protein [Flavobacterium sp.]|uniref:O-antigen ligase family protein n=1 Tax=Flavobacterium sp. TaxID=239 RepID=UPI00374DBF56